eukprot:TRINITY_DN5270_c0_g1_i3.p1 TRINITY_DN5270_c0_g1~~TRINITY_DN5270_c0_g1_i3.p1  ORF type:complete len:242 (+),score=25.84 TRINITY_DN5270_c0_g1_i3:52-726(+)
MDLYRTLLGKESSTQRDPQSCRWRAQVACLMVKFLRRVQPSREILAKLLQQRAPGFEQRDVMAASIVREWRKLAVSFLGCVSRLPEFPTEAERNEWAKLPGRRALLEGLWGPVLDFGMDVFFRNFPSEEDILQQWTLASFTKGLKEKKNKHLGIDSSSFSLLAFFRLPSVWERIKVLSEASPERLFCQDVCKAFSAYWPRLSEEDFDRSKWTTELGDDSDMAIF